MTTTTTATAAAPILAIEMGKYKSVACVYRSADDLRFHSVTTSRDELARLLEPSPWPLNEPTNRRTLRDCCPRVEPRHN